MRRRRPTSFASFEPRERTASAASGSGVSSPAARQASPGASPRYAIPAVREVLRRTAEPQAFASIW